MVHGCVVYTECTKMAAVSCGTSHVRAVISVDIYSKMHYKKPVTHVESHVSAESASEWKIALDKSDQQKTNVSSTHYHYAV